MIRQGFTGITKLFIDTVQRVGDTQWQQPGLGEWTVRELAGHVCMGTFLNIEPSLDQPAERVDLHRPVEFWVRGRPADHDATVAQGGRDMGVALGDDPVRAVGHIVDRVCARVDETSDEAILNPRGWRGKTAL